jgi:WYL_2, Sm-like SH3 beta-barrel fold
MTQIVYTETNPANPENICKLLQEHICTVSFTKINGETRDMPCTLRADLVPAKPLTEAVEHTPRKQSENTISVWCTDAAGWRSFRWDSVTQIKVVN